MIFTFSVCLHKQILIYNEITKFKKTNTIEKKHQIAVKINETFLVANAVLEVNVTNSAKEKVRKKIEQNNIDDELFDEIRADILVNMSDTFNRFSKTKEFQTYDKNEKVAADLLKEAGMQ